MFRRLREATHAESKFAAEIGVNFGLAYIFHTVGKSYIVSNFPMRFSNLAYIYIKFGKDSSSYLPF